MDYLEIMKQRHSVRQYKADPIPENIRKSIVTDGEKQVILISIGYGASQGVAHKSRPAEELSSVSGNVPDWFQTGMEAAMLSPTAVNQQKFMICYDGSKLTAKGSSSADEFDDNAKQLAKDNNVRLINGKGYAKMISDIGIDSHYKIYIKDRVNNVPLSLHDSKIQKIDVINDSLQLTMDKIYQYRNGKETSYHGVIEFTKTDIDECKIMVFDNPYGFEGEKSFTGRSYSLGEYKEKYPNAEFEIITEGYNGYDTSYQGWIWDEESEPLFGIMNIWNSGDMIYKIEPIIRDAVD